MVVGRFAGQVAVAVSQRWRPDGDSAGVVCEVFIGLELSVQGDFFSGAWLQLVSGCVCVRGLTPSRSLNAAESEWAPPPPPQVHPTQLLCLQ